MVTWSQIAQSWLNACEDGQEEYISPVRDAILRNLLPLNVPPVQPLADGRVFLTVDNIHPFWSLYARSTEENTRGLLGEICTALGLPEATIGGAAITAEVLVSRIKRYLIQHPYIRTLTINAFNSGRTTVHQRPVITLGLTPEQRELMHNIHQVCDWVFTIDRNIGIEFFDHGGRSQRPPYLVDYLPNATASFGHKLVVTSRSLSELESNLSQVLEKQYQIKLQANQATVILEQLRSLSGRLALKLLSSATQQSEVIGLAFARLFLQYQGASQSDVPVIHIAFLHQRGNLVAIECLVDRN